jgi:MFS family permease
MSVLRIRDFRLLWLGEAISGLGDQFALIALPWLALVLTGSGLALGSVLAVMALPRAALMIVGGAYVDRLSPRRVMLISNAVRLIAISALGAAVAAGVAQLWMLYAFGLVFGISDAFFYPASTSIAPSLVPGERLAQANALVQGTAQLSVFLGPAAAGLLIAVLGSSANRPSTEGIGVALLIDGVSFAVSLATLWLIRGGRATSRDTAKSLVSDIREGIAFIWKWPSMRLIVLLSMAANLLVMGPFEIGIPVLAYTRLPEGAAAFGTMTAAFGLGSLIGLGAVAALPPPRASFFSFIALGTIAFAGVCTAVLGTVAATLPAVVLTFLIGVGLGTSNLMTVTWIQRRIPGSLMGRVMALMMFASLGLVPVSEIVAGVFVQVSLTGLFVVGGLGLAALTMAALLSSAIRAMGSEPVVDADGAAPAAA